MRQLVAIVLPERVHFYLDEGGRNVDELATISNRGDLSVQQILELGANLADALHVNGVEVVRPKPEPRAKKAPAKAAPAKRTRVRSYNVSAEEVLADIRAHPGTTCRESADRVVSSMDATPAMQLINRRAGELHKAGLIRYDERVDPTQKGRPPRTYTAIEQPSPPPAYVHGGPPAEV